MDFIKRLLTPKYAGTTPNAPEPAAVIAQVMDNHITPIMKPQGFKKRGRTYYRQQGDMLYLLSFVGSRWNNTGDATFYVEVGVLHGPTYQIAWHTALPITPAAHDGQLVQRLENIAPPTAKTPDAWEFTSKTDIDAVGARMAEIVAQSVFGFFEAYPDVDSLLPVADTRHGNGDYGTISSLDAGIIVAVQGDKKLAAELFWAYAKPGTGAYRNRITYETAKQVGVHMDLPRLATEQRITFDFAIKGSMPVHDERRSVNSIDNRLYTLSEKGLGYACPWDCRAVPGRYRLSFYTLEPAKVLAALENRLQKLAVKPVVMLNEKPV